MRTSGKIAALTLLVTAVVVPGRALALLAQQAELTVPPLVLTGTPFTATVTGYDGDPVELRIRIGGSIYSSSGAGDDGIRFAGLLAPARGAVTVELQASGVHIAAAETRAIPGWVSVVPPVLAIVVALISKQVIPALFLGLWVGSTAVVGFGAVGLLKGLLDAFALYVLGSVTDVSHAQIILFSFMIGGMVGIIIKNGGMQGVVNVIVRWATSPARGQVTTGVLGVVIFFDDYANTLVVGNTMRQVTDRLRISREKLAYIVDSTAAPISCVALVSTWIGYQVGLIGTSIQQIPALQMSAYSIFLSSIAYSFYPFLTMFLVFMLAVRGRDFGPMHAAEERARSTGQVLGPDAKVDSAADADATELALNPGKPRRAVNAVLPILVLVFGVIGGLLVTGQGDGLRETIASADSYMALMWGSLLSVMCAVLLSLGQRILSMNEIVDAWYAGMKSMLYAMVILVLAWSLSAVAVELNTAGYLVSVLGESLSPALVPSLVFVLASATAFATGSSWATMGILMPLVVPLVWAVMGGTAGSGSMHILFSTVSCVLAGSVFGDHCSPISDTTILSSMASGCDHIEHVRTQLPYAATVGLFSVLFGTLPAGFGLPWWIGMLAGAAALYGVVQFLGRPVSEVPADAS